MKPATGGRREVVHRFEQSPGTQVRFNASTSWMGSFQADQSEQSREGSTPHCSNEGVERLCHRFVHLNRSTVGLLHGPLFVIVMEKIPRE